MSEPARLIRSQLRDFVQAFDNQLKRMPRRRRIKALQAVDGKTYQADDQVIILLPGSVAYVGLYGKIDFAEIFHRLMKNTGHMLHRPGYPGKAAIEGRTHRLAGERFDGNIQVTGRKLARAWEQSCGFHVGEIDSDAGRAFPQLSS